MPKWLEQIILSSILKLLTPELIQQIKEAAVLFVSGQLKEGIAKLRELAKMSDSSLDDVLVEKLAQILGIPAK